MVLNCNSAKLANFEDFSTCIGGGVFRKHSVVIEIATHRWVVCVVCVWSSVTAQRSVDCRAGFRLSRALFRQKCGAPPKYTNTARLNSHDTHSDSVVIIDILLRTRIT